MKEQKRKQFEEFLSHIKDKKLVELLNEEMKSSSYRYTTYSIQYKDNYYLVVHNSYFEDEGCRDTELDKIISNSKLLIKTDYYSLYDVTKEKRDKYIQKIVNLFYMED